MLHKLSNLVVVAFMVFNLMANVMTASAATGNVPGWSGEITQNSDTLTFKIHHNEGSNNDVASAAFYIKYKGQRDPISMQKRWDWKTSSYVLNAGDSYQVDLELPHPKEVLDELGPEYMIEGETCAYSVQADVNKGISTDNAGDIPNFIFSIHVDVDAPESECLPPPPPPQVPVYSLSCTEAVVENDNDGIDEPLTFAPSWTSETFLVPEGGNITFPTAPANTEVSVKVFFQGDLVEDKPLGICRKVENLACVSLTVDPNEGDAPLTVEAEIKHNDAVSAEIFWGEGEIEALPEFKGIHTYNNEGIYSLKAWVIGSNGDRVSAPLCEAQVKVDDQTPDHPLQQQKVKSYGSRVAWQDWAKTQPNAEQALKDYAYKYNNLVDGTVITDDTTIDPRYYALERWLTDPTQTLYWDYILNLNPVNVEGKGLGVQFDSLYRRNGEALSNSTLYSREDHQASQGIWTSEEVYGPMEIAGPKATWIPGLQGHFEQYFEPEAWFAEVDITNAIEEPDPDWAVQLYRHGAEVGRLYSIFWGLHAGNKEQMLTWRATGRYNGLMDTRTSMYRWEGDLASHPSKSISNFFIKGQTLTYWGFYGLSGIEFAWNPAQPNPWMYDVNGNLLLSQEDFNNWLDAVPTYQLDGEMVKHNQSEVVAFEVMTAKLMVKYGLADQYLTRVPDHLVDEVGSAGSGIDYAYLAQK